MFWVFIEKNGIFRGDQEQFYHVEFLRVLVLGLEISKRSNFPEFPRVKLCFVFCLEFSGVKYQIGFFKISMFSTPSTCLLFAGNSLNAASDQLIIL